MRRKHIHIFCLVLLPGFAFSDPSCNAATERKQVKVGHSPSTPNLRVILIRHGESENNVHNEIGGDHYQKHRQADPPLTTNGRQQAQETAEYLKECDNALLRGIDEIYVSPFLRTLQTCQPIAEVLEISPKVWNEIHEVGGANYNGTALPGMSKSQILKDFPDFIVDDVTEAGWYTGAGKESRVEGKARIKRVYDQLKQLAKDRDRTIVLVVHGMFIDFLLQVAFSLESTDRRFHCWNTCISVLDINTNGESTLLMHNSVSHLTIVKTESLGKC